MPPANDEVTRPLTQQEIDDLREILEADRRAKWLWSSVRAWMVWTTAVIGGATLFWESAGKIVKTLAGK